MRVPAPSPRPGPAVLGLRLLLSRADDRIDSYKLTGSPHPRPSRPTPRRPVREYITLVSLCRRPAGLRSSTGLLDAFAEIPGAAVASLLSSFRPPHLEFAHSPLSYPLTFSDTSIRSSTLDDLNPFTPRTCTPESRAQNT